jgi:hypothetical protein
LRSATKVRLKMTMAFAGMLRVYAAPAILRKPAMTVAARWPYASGGRPNCGQCRDASRSQRGLRWPSAA